jgi:hypothetical protein
MSTMAEQEKTVPQKPQIKEKSLSAGEFLDSVLVHPKGVTSKVCPITEHFFRVNFHVREGELTYTYRLVDSRFLEVIEKDGEMFVSDQTIDDKQTRSPVVAESAIYKEDNIASE